MHTSEPASFTVNEEASLTSEINTLSQKPSHNDGLTDIFGYLEKYILKIKKTAPSYSLNTIQ